MSQQRQLIVINKPCRRSSCLVASVLSCLILLPTTADAGELTDSVLKVFQSGDPGDVYVVRTGLGHSFGDGVGYDGGFSSYSNFIPLIEEPDRWLLFADVHLLMNNQAAVGGNIGYGQRIYDDQSNRTWGLFAWYDFRETPENWFHQMTIGAETLGQYFDLRSNLYIPSVADDRLPNPAGNHFLGNQLVIADEAALTGIDFEAGTAPIAWGDVTTRGYAGGYYLRGTGSPDTWGWRHRVELEWTDRLLVNVSAQDDDLFGRTVTLGVTIHSLQAVEAPAPSPSWPPFHTMHRRTQPVDRSDVASRLAEPTRRFRNIMIHRQERVATDPTTGAALSFLHVVPSGTGAFGTIESPYGSFVAAMADPRAANSLVYTPQGGTFTESISLVSGTQLVSSYHQQHVATQGGQRRLPWSGGSIQTILNGDITLASKTLVDGFDINGQIVGNEVESLTLYRNLITPVAGRNGIELVDIDNSGNPILISDNTITAADTGISAFGNALDLDLTDNTIVDAVVQAITIEADGPDASNWLVTGNALSGTNAGTGTEATFTNSGIGSVILTLTGNSSSNTVGTGVYNFDLLNTGGGTFTLQPAGSDTDEVGSSDSSVTIP
jgi:hypothetical protein